MAHSSQVDAMPVVRERKDFDARSGNPLERLIFNHRMVIVIVCALITLVLGFEAARLQVNASFEKMMPQSQPFIKNYLANRDGLRGLGNAIRIVVENTQGDVYDAEYLRALQKINDTVYLIPGVDRSYMKSLWMPLVRWTQVTEEGFKGGPVMPEDFDGSARLTEQLRNNVARAGIVGSIVANDQRSSMILVPLIDHNPQTGKPLDYAELSQKIERQVRSLESAAIRIHIVGFAKLVGDLIDGLRQVMAFFVISAIVAALVIFFYTRCLRSTVLVLSCSLAAVTWQLGLIHLLGFALDPYSVLVPFLVFAIGVSHGAQKMNGITQDVGRGTHRYVAARYTFRRLFLAGLTALVADAVGFAVLMIIDIPVIRDLAMTASLGVGVLIFTNLVLLPVLLSYVGVRKQAVPDDPAEQAAQEPSRYWAFLERFCERRWATGALAIAALLGIAGYALSLQLKTGDLDPGAPELRADSRYNRDNAYITKHYGLSSDQFVVMVRTPVGGIGTFPVLTEIDRLEQKLRQLPSVQTTMSVADMARVVASGSYEGIPKWLSINRDFEVLGPIIDDVAVNNGELVDGDRALAPVIVYLQDHKAETLDRVVAVASEFAVEHSSEQQEFLLAAGSAGIEAATNIAVREANRTMLLFVYAAVILLCLITFRSWRAVIVAVVPLVITSILCEALMVMLGIGIKVATLPVIALGVGIGVDYALYLLSVQLDQQRAGLPLKQAYRRALGFTGKMVALVGVTLAAGVVSWAWSPIKFQADMGILLTFMFTWNMLGALVLIPALSHFLLNTPAALSRPQPGQAAGAGFRAAAGPQRSDH